MKHIILGTAGHIDHGKTELVRALTGIDTDRLKEEKDRGISIELGFAPLRFDDDILAGIIDVPGHEKFIKTMLAGSSGIDLVLLCISDEGIMPQTREHVQIINLLGIQNGIVVITKSDLINPADREVFKKNIELELKNTFINEAPLIFTSARDREGIDELKEKIKAIAKRIKPKRESGFFRMAVDRVFSIKGFGTVVTGTSQRGKIKIGDEIAVYSNDKSRQEVKVRNIESFDSKVSESKGGMRLGINLGNLDKSSVRRGDILGLPGKVSDVKVFDSWIENTHSSIPLKHQMDYRINFDTRETVCKLNFLSNGAEKEIENSESTFARIILEDKSYMEFGQRFVLRNQSPLITVGGGILLYPDPIKTVRDKAGYIEELKSLKSLDVSAVIETFLKRSRMKGLIKEDLSILLDRIFCQKEINSALDELEKSEKVYKLYGNDIYLSSDNYKACREALNVEIERISKKNSLKGGVNSGELRQIFQNKIPAAVFGSIIIDMINEDVLTKQGDLLSLKSNYSHLSVLEKNNLESILNEIKKGKLTPPNLKEISRSLNFPRNQMEGYIKLLERKGKIVRVSKEMYFSSTVIKDLQNSLIRVIKEKECISVSDFKQLSGTSRKYSIPLLEYFDSVKITLRKTDNSRIMGAAIKD